MAAISVLIADDSEFIRDPLTETLSKIPNVKAPAWAGSLRETMLQLEAWIPDVLVLDLEFPDGNGYEVLQKLSDARQRPVTIVFTQHATAQHRLRSLELRADLFLDKSHGFTVLVDFLGWLARERNIVSHEH